MSADYGPAVWYPPKTLERFFRKVQKSDGCWIWTAARASGYGVFGYGGKLHRAHRVSYEIHKGAIPEGLVLDHLCRNPLCVNPDHLEAVTQAVNSQRSITTNQTGKCPYGHDFAVTGRQVRHRTERGGAIHLSCAECNRIRAKKWHDTHKGRKIA